MIQVTTCKNYQTVNKDSLFLEPKKKRSNSLILAEKGALFVIFTPKQLSFFNLKQQLFQFALQNLNVVKFLKKNKNKRRAIALNP